MTKGMITTQERGMLPTDGSESVNSASMIVDDHDRWAALRKDIANRPMQCHDCRALRNVLVHVMDILIPYEKPVPDAFAKAPQGSSAFEITAHSEVQINEPGTVIDVK